MTVPSNTGEACLALKRPLSTKLLKRSVESYLHSLNTDQMHGWLNKQVTYAAAFMLLTAESLGYDTAAMEGFEEDKVREALRLPPLSQTEEK